MTLDVNICHGGLGLGRDYRSIFKIKFMVVSFSSGSESRIKKPAPKKTHQLGTVSWSVRPSVRAFWLTRVLQNAGMIE